MVIYQKASCKLLYGISLEKDVATTLYIIDTLIPQVEKHNN